MMVRRTLMVATIVGITLHQAGAQFGGMPGMPGMPGMRRAQKGTKKAKKKQKGGRPGGAPGGKSGSRPAGGKPRTARRGWS